jgi:hypothetical protein
MPKGGGLSVDGGDKFAMLTVSRFPALIVND